MAGRENAAAPAHPPTIPAGRRLLRSDIPPHLGNNTDVLPTSHGPRHDDAMMLRHKVTQWGSLLIWSYVVYAPSVARLLLHCCCTPPGRLRPSGDGSHS